MAQFTLGRATLFHPWLLEVKCSEADYGIMNDVSVFVTLFLSYYDPGSSRYDIRNGATINSMLFLEPRLLMKQSFLTASL